MARSRTLRQGPFGPIVRTAQEIESEILNTSGLGVGDVMAVDFEETPQALPPVARWMVDIREIQTFEIIGQVEADTFDALKAVIAESGVNVPRG